MKKLLFLILLVSSFCFVRAERFYPAATQVCWDQYGSGFCSPPPTLGAGDTIVFAAGGTCQTFALFNFHGAPGDSIVVMNEGGQVAMGAMTFENCSYIKLNGWGVTGVPYGFRFAGTTVNFSPAITIRGRSKSFDVFGFDVYKMGYIVMEKTDFSCVDSTNYPNWIMDSIKTHDFRADSIYQDGVYDGNTNPEGDIFTCDGVTSHKYPMQLSNFWVYNSIITRVQRTAIQLSLCKNGWIYNNVIDGAGYEYDQSQGGGIIIGGSSQNIHVYDNDIRNTFISGISCQGRLTNYICNNRVDSSGFLQIPWWINIDSLAKQMDVNIALVNGAWNTGVHHIQYVGRTLYNTYSQPSSLLFAPFWDEYGVMEGTEALDSAQIVWKDNLLGASMDLDQTTYEYIGSLQNKLVFMNYFRTPFGYNSYICNNRTLDGSTVITPSTAGKHYFTDCLDMELPDIPMRPHSIFKIITGSLSPKRN